MHLVQVNGIKLKTKKYKTNKISDGFVAQHRATDAKKKPKYKKKCDIGNYLL